MRYLLILLLFQTTRLLAQDLNYELIIAAENGNKKEVYQLIRQGADVNAKTYEGITPLMYAIQNGHNSIAQVLIEKGADVNTVPSNGIPALVAAVNAGNLQGTFLLLDNGANPHYQNTYKQMPLCLAVIDSDYEMTKLLLDFSEYFTKDYLGNTDLFYAAENGDTAIVRLLVEHGAIINEQNNSGVTPLMAAAANGNYETVRYFVNHKADISITDDSNYTALLYAIRSKNVKIVDLLIDNGADVNHPVKRNLYPLEMAKYNGNRKIVKTLKQSGAKISYIPHFNALGFDTGILAGSNDVFYSLGASIHDMKYNLQLRLGYATRFGREKIWITKNNITYNQYREKRRMFMFSMYKNLNFIPNQPGEFGIYAGGDAIFSAGNYKGLEKHAERLTFISPTAGLYFLNHETNLGFKVGYHYVDFEYYKANKNYFSFNLIFKLPFL